MLWILTVLSIAGVILNVKKKRLGFAFWIFSNAAWAIINFKSGMIEQGALFVVYFALAIWGLVSWKATESIP